MGMTLKELLTKGEGTISAKEAKAYAKPQGDWAARAGMSAWAQI